MNVEKTTQALNYPNDDVFGSEEDDNVLFENTDDDLVKIFKNQKSPFDSRDYFYN